MYTAGYQDKILNDKGNSPGVIPVKTSWAEKGAGNRVMEPTICLDIQVLLPHTTRLNTPCIFFYFDDAVTPFYKGFI